MGQTISSRGRDTAALVAKRLDPWNRGRCAYISRTWNRAIHEVSSSSPDANNQHWLVGAESGNSCLSMCNVVTGEQKVVKPDFPWASIPTDPEHADDDIPDDNAVEDVEDVQPRLARAWRVLCSFQGLLLISLGSKHKHNLVLGDPLLNKWVKLPTPEWPPSFSFLPVAAFCPATNTIMVTTDVAHTTATFDIATAEWVVDPLHDSRVVFDPAGHACCLDGIFYCTFEYFPYETKGNTDPYCCIACYDPVNDRSWRIVGEFYLWGDCYIPIFLAEQSRDKMLVYMVPDRCGARHFELFEAFKSKGSGELEIVPCPLMDDARIGERIKLDLELLGDRPMDDQFSIFHGKGDMFFWDTFYLDKMLVLSLQHGQGIVKELKGMRINSIFPYSRCYYAPAPGTCELLQNLAAKIEQNSDDRT